MPTNVKNKRNSGATTRTSTKLNKYNIRAIRKELDDCVRCESWNRFRAAFESIQNNTDTCRAVVECLTPLLHALCRCSGVPLDVVEALVHAVPTAIYLTNHRGSTPLHVCIDRDASPKIVDCFLRCDAQCQQQPKQLRDEHQGNGNRSSSNNNNINSDKRRLLYMADAHGDTPLLLAVRSYSQNYIMDDVLRLMVKYDQPDRKQSLLVQSIIHHRTALWYIAKQEMRACREDEGDDMGIPPILAWMLQQTYEALQVRDKASVTGPASSSSSSTTIGHNHIRDLTAACFDGGALDNVHCQSKALFLRDLIQATVACSQLLDDKHASKLLGLLLSQESLRESDEWLATPVDTDGNLLLHWTCAHPHQGVTVAAEFGAVSFCAYLVRRYPEAAQLANTNGNNLPLHLLLLHSSCCCSWEQHQQAVSMLIDAHVEALKTPNAQGELPLHLALKQCHQQLRFTTAVRSLGQRLELAKQLWHFCPETAQCMDPVTGLFPFQLASVIAFETSRDDGAAASSKHTTNHQYQRAVGGTSNSKIKANEPRQQRQLGQSSTGESIFDGLLANRENDATDPVIVLDVVYFLLRQSPQVLQYFPEVHTTDRHELLGIPGLISS